VVCEREPLPIRHPPKQFRIAAMGNDVVNALSPMDAAAVLVEDVDCERIRSKKRF
jgi:hypothetical protein